MPDSSAEDLVGQPAEADLPPGQASASSASPRWRILWFALGGWLLVSAASLLIRQSIPPRPIFGSVYDDELQVALAHALMNGQWLGDWWHSTLSKGPGYPFFLVFAKLFGLPPAVATQFVYLFGATLVAVGLWAWTRRVGVASIAYVVLALNPAMLGASASRVYREGFTAAMALTALGLVICLSFLASSRCRVACRILAVIGPALALGVTLGWMALTRVDTFWVFATFIPIIIGGVFWGSESWHDRAVRGGTMLFALSCAGIPAVGMTEAVAQINQAYYGVDLVDDFADGAFPAAHNSWSSVEAGPTIEAVPISAAQRRAVYEVSPTARLLEPYLEGEGGSPWRNTTCDSDGICVDFKGGWFPWALREAAMSTTQVTDAKSFQELFAQLDAEITDACESGQLECSDPGLGPGLPSLSEINKGTVLTNLWSALRGGYLDMQAGGHSRGSLEAVDHPSLSLWQSTVIGISAEPSDFETAVAVVRLDARGYVLASYALIVPALVGLAWAILHGGVHRRAGVIGVSSFAGVGAHSSILAVWAAGTGAPLGQGLYLIASTAYFLLGMSIGVWCVATLAYSRIRRRRPEPAGDAELATSGPSTSQPST